MENVNSAKTVELELLRLNCIDKCKKDIHEIVREMELLEKKDASY